MPAESSGFRQRGSSLDWVRKEQFKLVRDLARPVQRSLTTAAVEGRRRFSELANALHYICLRRRGNQRGLDRNIRRNSVPEVAYLPRQAGNCLRVVELFRTLSTVQNYEEILDNSHIAPVVVT